MSKAIVFIFVLLIAILVDILFGEPANLWHPVSLQGRLISSLWERRPDKGARRLFFWGLIILILGLTATVMVTVPLQWALQYFLFSVKWSGKSPAVLSVEWFNLSVKLLAVLFLGLLLKPAFSLRALFRAGRQVARALDTDNLAAARHLLGYHLVSRDTGNLDASQLSSAAIESLSENFTDSFAAPTAFFAVGGISAAWAYRFTNTADAMLGYRDGDKEFGGKAAAGLDDILNWIPARAAGYIIAVAAIITGDDFRGALKIMRLDARNCTSPNSGWTMAAAAGALNLRLEKDGVYILNSEGRLPVADDLRRLEKLLSWAAIFWTLSLVGLMIPGHWAFIHLQR